MCAGGGGGLDSETWLVERGTSKSRLCRSLPVDSQEICGCVLLPGSPINLVTGTAQGSEDFFLPLFGHWRDSWLCGVMGSI